MSSEETVILSRPVQGVKIPSGDPISLNKGASVTITQSLGGSYTVLYSNAYLVRIDAKDGDALGKEAVLPATAVVETGPVNEAQIFDKLRLVFDPEIPVNIVDLGLVYDCRVVPVEEGDEKGGYKVEVKMTLTAPGCGMGPVIAGDAREKIMSLPGITDANVELVWTPPWNQAMISEVGKMQLGLM